MTFTGGAPFDGQSLGASKPEVRGNFTNYNTVVSVDHVAPNQAAQGQHKQVTFNSNNVPTPPVSPPVLFTNTVGGIPQLFWYSGDAAHSSNQYQNSISPLFGSTYLMGGIILKWSNVAQIPLNTKDVTITFASLGLNPFPNNCMGVWAIPNSLGAGLTSGNYPGTSSPTATQFVLSRNAGNIAATNYWILAIGY